MNYITKNLKVIEIISAMLIIVGMVYDVIKILDSTHISTYISIAFQLIAYCFALNYVFRGYKKDASNSYIIFLYAYLASLISTLIRSFDIGRSSTFSIVLLIIEIVCILILALVKNLGKKISCILVSTNLALSVIKLVKQLFTAKDILKALSSTLSGVVIGIVLFIFVLAKYADKESRGAL